MRSKLFVVALLFVALVAFATGSEEATESGWVEQEGPVRVGIWGGDAPIDASNSDSMLYYADYLFGDMDVEMVFYNDSAEISHPIVLEVASGDQPDIYKDYLGRVSMFANARYAHAVTPLVGQELVDQYIPSFLDLMTKDGVLYGLPETAWISTMIVNVTLLERVGMLDVIEDGHWTIEEFLEASRRVKALGDDYYGYCLFSKDTGGDYWYLGFLTSFGADLYSNGQIAINSDAGRAALEFYKAYDTEGLSPPGPASRDDNAFQVSWHTGKYLATARNPEVAADITGEKSFETGLSEEAFKAVAIAFPTAEGIERAPVALGPDGVMMFDKGGLSQEVVDVFTMISGLRAQTWRAKQNRRYSSLTALTGARPNDALYEAGSAILASEGVWDMGIGLQTYAPIRLLVPPMFQAIYTGELTIQEAIDRFDAAGSKILNE